MEFSRQEYGVGGHFLLQWFPVLYSKSLMFIYFIYNALYPILLIYPSSSPLVPISLFFMSVSLSFKYIDVIIFFRHAKLY